MMLTKEMESSTKENVLTHDLIRGEFKADDAAEIVNHMLTTKINFHERRNFSSQIRFGEKDMGSSMRLQELEEARKEIEEMIQLAKTNGREMKITSSLSIELI